MSDRLDHPVWSDPLHDEREEARAAAFDEHRRDDAPSPAEYKDDLPYSPRKDRYRGVCGGCHQPVSAFLEEPGGHEGSCLWKGGAWHPSCREADPERPAIMAHLLGATDAHR